MTNKHREKLKKKKSQVCVKYLQQLVHLTPIQQNVPTNNIQIRLFQLRGHEWGINSTKDNQDLPLAQTIAKFLCHNLEFKQK